MVKYFIEVHKLDPEAKSKYGESTLHLSYDIKNEEITNYLIKEAKVDPGVMN